MKNSMAQYHTLHRFLISDYTQNGRHRHVLHQKHGAIAEFPAYAMMSQVSSAQQLLRHYAPSPEAKEDSSSGTHNTAWVTWTLLIGY